MSKSYLLTSTAEADLRDIIRYTRRQWGDVQVRRYIGALDKASLVWRPVQARSRT